MYYLWYYENDKTLRRSNHGPKYKTTHYAQTNTGWKTRQAAHVFKTRNGLTEYIVLKAPESKQVDLEDYIKKKGP